jgi:hypothetical protein
MREPTKTERQTISDISHNYWLLTGLKIPEWAIEHSLTQRLPELEALRPALGIAKSFDSRPVDAIRGKDLGPVMVDD